MIIFCNTHNTTIPVNHSIDKQLDTPQNTNLQWLSAQPKCLMRYKMRHKFIWANWSDVWGHYPESLRQVFGSRRLCRANVYLWALIILWALYFEVSIVRNLVCPISSQEVLNVPSKKLHEKRETFLNVWETKEQARPQSHGPLFRRKKDFQISHTLISKNPQCFTVHHHTQHIIHINTPNGLHERRIMAEPPFRELLNDALEGTTNLLDQVISRRIPRLDKLPGKKDNEQ